jgi:hypothetical protein
MSLARWAKKRDTVETDIVAMARGLGARVWRLDRPVDLLLMFCGRWHLAECKTGTKKLNAEQLEFYRCVQEAGGQVFLWKSVDDVARDLNSVRARSWRMV